MKLSGIEDNDFKNIEWKIGELNGQASNASCIQAVWLRIPQYIPVKATAEYCVQDCAGRASSTAEVYGTLY